MGLFDEVCASVEAGMAETATPGVAVGLLHEGEERLAGFGVTSVESPVDVTPNTLFQIGSITKTFTATLVMMLVERGELDLDVPVRRYLPTLRLADDSVAASVTLRHLLTHTGGWVGDWFADHGAGDDALAAVVDDLQRLPQLTPLGTVWSYNNAGFYLAGRVVEVVAGEPYERVATRLVLDPLGLEHTSFFVEDVMTRRFAVGHQRAGDGGAEVARPWAIGRAHHAAGGLASTVGDLLRYARFQLSDGEGLLGRALLDRMHSPQIAAAPSFGSVGIAWGVDDSTGIRLVHHGGGTRGQISLLVLAPASRTVLAIVTNHQRGGEITESARRLVVEALGGVVRMPVAVVLDAAEYLGVYRTPLMDVELAAGEQGLRLVIRNRGGFPAEDSPPMPDPPPYPVAFSERDRLYVTDGPGAGGEAEFLRGDDGRIAWLRLGGRVMQPVR